MSKWLVGWFYWQFKPRGIIKSVFLPAIKFVQVSNKKLLYIIYNNK